MPEVSCPITRKSRCHPAPIANSSQRQQDPQTNNHRSQIPACQRNAVRSTPPAGGWHPAEPRPQAARSHRRTPPAHWPRRNRPVATRVACHDHGTALKGFLPRDGTTRLPVMGPPRRAGLGVTSHDCLVLAGRPAACMSAACASRLTLIHHDRCGSMDSRDTALESLAKCGHRRNRSGWDPPCGHGTRSAAGARSPY